MWRDEEDGHALALELAQVGEQLVDLLGHEHRGGLVEDQDAGAAVEHLEDLDPLAVADAEVVDQRVGVDVEAVGGRAPRCVGARAEVDPTVPLLVAEDDVLEDGEVVGEHEVLVHHADADRDRVAGRVKLPRAVDRDGALVGTLHAVEDLHQGRLAGAVLADDGVDRAAPRPEVDVVVGDDTGEALGDALELDGGSWPGRTGGAVGRSGGAPGRARSSDRSRTTSGSVALRRGGDRDLAVDDLLLVVVELGAMSST